MTRFALLSLTLALTAHAQEAAPSKPAAPAPKAAPVEEEIPFPAHIPIPPADVLSPEDTLKTLTVPAGYRVELVASEPMITAPVAMQWDENGRLWVVEMNGYMPNVDAKGEDIPNGRVVVCEDTDGDGKMDKSTVFLDKLVMPRAIMLRKGGALVAVPPSVFWCPDADGDLVADKQEPVIPTYTAGGNPEHMPNGLLLAIDNWIYSAKANKRYRFAASGELKNDATLFRGQWGICQDDTGRLFYNYNSDALRADLLPGDSLQRNSNFKSPPGANDQISKSQRVYPGRVNPGINRGYRKGMLSEDGRLKEFTAASGPLIYRGDLFPEDFYGNAFVPEPSANMVKRYILTERDGDVMAKDAYEEEEFLTSTSERFRPVNIYDGPDGAIYVVDMARGIIQHITYVTPWLRRQYVERQLDQPLNQGRIWRVVPDKAERRPAPQLAGATAEQLVAELSSENGWTRDTAQRLLVERADAKSVPLIEDAARHAEVPLGRLHALWTLEGMEKLTPAAITAGLSEPDPRVRAAAIRMSEPFLAKDKKLADRVLALAKDPAAEVQLQLLLTLGELRSEKADAAMAAVLEQCIENRLAHSAALSGLKGRELEFLKRLTGSASWNADSPGRAYFLGRLARCVVEERKPERLTAAIELAAKAGAKAAWQQKVILDGLAGIVPAFAPPAGSIADEQSKIGTKPKGESGLGKAFKPVRLKAEPPQFAKLATSPNEEVKKRAAKVAAVFTWPGKPGHVEEAKAPPLTEAQKQFVAAGKQLYMVCGACHQPTGLGQEGLAPPLANSEWVTGPEGRLIRIVLQGVGGPMTVNDKEYNLDMAPLGAALNDEQIAQILSYIRRDFGNEAPVIETATVTKIREATKDRGASWTADELLNIN